MNPDAIPQELRDRARWITWRWKRKLASKKPTKQPCWFDGDTLRYQAFNEPEAWCTFDEVKDRLVDARITGLGFHFKGMIEDEDPIVAVDVDDCRDPDTGELTDKALVYINKLKSYSEVTPSGTGIRILVKARLVNIRGRQKDYKSAKVELFVNSGFVTVSGEHIEGTPTDIKDRLVELTRIQDDLFPVSNNVADRLNLSSMVYRDKDSQIQWATELVAALDLDRCNDYLEWVEIGMALKSVDDSLYALWDEWSSESPLYAGQEETRAKWDSFSEGGVGDIGIGTLHYYAAADGWKPSGNSVARPSANKADPGDLAEKLIATAIDSASGVCRLACLNSQMYVWEGGRYRRKCHGEWRSEIAGYISTIYRQMHLGLVGATIEVFKARQKIYDASPCWLADPVGHPRWDVRDIMCTPSQIVYLPTMQAVPATPALFSTESLAVDFDPAAPEPVAWLEFLDSLWGDLPDKEDYFGLLQQWFGYCLTSDTSHQAMLLLTGPTRCGKGTIARVLSALVGKDQYTGSDMSAIGRNFGLQGLLDKRLCIFGDVRLNGQQTNRTLITERLLSITGGDTVTVDVKNQHSRELRLPIKLMALCNQLPELEDEAKALTARYRILEMRKSFLGKEDPRLDEKLYEELPGILRWAIEGWQMLQIAGFVEPAGAESLKRIVNQSGAPLATFLDECTVLGGEISSKDLYEAYDDWNSENGFPSEGVRVFGKRLRDLRPGVERVRKQYGSDREWVYEGISLQ